MPQLIPVEGLSNLEFFERHAAPGRIGLVGGSEITNRMILRAQRHLTPDRKWSLFSHAFLFQGRRADGHHWVFESDLMIQHKNIRLGVQENRLAKYHGDDSYPYAAVLDFGLTPEQTQKLMAAALELVAGGTRYSLREIVGTVWALRHPRWQPKENLLARERAFYCSAFVTHVLGEIGLKISDTAAVKNTTPEHIAQTTTPHTQWLMVRGERPISRVRSLAHRVRAKLRGED